MTIIQNHNFASPLRYPGGKGVLANFMKLVIVQNGLLDGEYVEVYAGGAGIAWSLLFEEYVYRLHVNDLDTGLMAFWRTLVENTDALCRLIQDTPVTVHEWRRQQTIHRNQHDHSTLEVGFSVFFLNRVNRSGIMTGGVIGGTAQTGSWKMDARFHKKDLIQRIQRIARYAGRIKLYNLDAADFIQTILPGLPQRTLVYLDPPYFKKGQDLYQNHYSYQDHARIAELVVQHVRQPWIVSYDAAPEILSTYKDHPRILYNIGYSARDWRMGSEVLFHSNSLVLPKGHNPTAIKLPILT